MQCIITNGNTEKDRDTMRDGENGQSAFRQHMQEEIQNTERELDALKETKKVMEIELQLFESNTLVKEKEELKKEALEKERVLKENEDLKKEIEDLTEQMQERDDVLEEIHKLLCTAKAGNHLSETPSPSALLSAVRRHFRENTQQNSPPLSTPHSLSHSRSVPAGAFKITTLKRSPSTEFLEVSRYLKDQQLKGENEAREWIENVAKLPIDGDLMESVTSGRVLCLLVNAIKPGTIKKIHETPNSPIMQMQNISSFLYGCELLGVRKTDLFDATDLFQKKNAAGIISTIHALGRASQNIKGFKGPYLTSKLLNEKGRDSPENI